MKNNHGKQNLPCKTLMKLFATGLACAAILIGGPIPAAPVNGNNSNGSITNGNTGSTGSWGGVWRLQGGRHE